MKSAQFSLLVLVVSVLTTALCYTNASSELEVNQARGEIHFLRRQKQRGSLMALTGGKLTLVDGCLRIVSKSGSSSRAVAWPYYFDFRRKDGKIEVLGYKDRIVARVGDTITVNGGETKLWYRGQVETKKPRNGHCVGPYWAAGDEVTVIKPR